MTQHTESKILLDATKITANQNAWIQTEEKSMNYKSTAQNLGSVTCCIRFLSTLTAWTTGDQLEDH